MEKLSMENSVLINQEYTSGRSLMEGEFILVFPEKISRGVLIKCLDYPENPLLMVSNDKIPVDIGSGWKHYLVKSATAKTVSFNPNFLSPGVSFQEVGHILGEYPSENKTEK